MSEWLLPFKDETAPQSEKFQRYEKEGNKTCGARHGELLCFLDNIHREFSNHVHRHPDGRLESWEEPTSRNGEERVWQK
jgi:hypothetical protein